jgi:hypothetical protein
VNRSITYALSTSLLMLAPALMASPRWPLGVYAVVNVKEYTADYLKTNPAATTAEIENHFNKTVFPDLLSNRAVSVAIYETWAQLNPNPPSSKNPYDWSLLDDLFSQVAVWNSQNPTFPPKTVQLVPTPGFNSPQWLLDEILSCDYLFSFVYPIPPLGSVCGSATFSGFVEGGVVDGKAVSMELPLPWDPTYKSAWQTFLNALAARYGSNPALVSVSVAGPTASSEEMILPTTATTSGAQIGGLTPEQMWDKLLAYQYSDPTYQESDQAFIDEWKNAIDM